MNTPEEMRAAGAVPPAENDDPEWLRKLQETLTQGLFDRIKGRPVQPSLNVRIVARDDASAALKQMQHSLIALNIPARRFVIVRSVDITGISGTGVILYGVEWMAGGPVDVYWLGTKTTGQYPSMEVVRATHCYNNNARIVYVDGEQETSRAADEGMTFRKFAKTWLEQSGLLDASADYDGWLGQCILDIAVFIADQGHSGQSVAAAISALNSIYDAYDNGESPIWQAYWESDEGKKRIKAAFEAKAPDAQG